MQALRNSLVGLNPALHKSWGTAIDQFNSVKAVAEKEFQQRTVGNVEYFVTTWRQDRVAELVKMAPVASDQHEILRQLLDDKAFKRREYKDMLVHPSLAKFLDKLRRNALLPPKDKKQHTLDKEIAKLQRQIEKSKAELATAGKALGQYVRRCEEKTIYTPALNLAACASDAAKLKAQTAETQMVQKFFWAALERIVQQAKPVQNPEQSALLELLTAQRFRPSQFTPFLADAAKTAGPDIRAFYRSLGFIVQNYKAVESDLRAAEHRNNDLQVQLGKKTGKLVAELELPERVATEDFADALFFAADGRPLTPPSLSPPSLSPPADLPPRSIPAVEVPLPNFVPPPATVTPTKTGCWARITNFFSWLIALPYRLLSTLFGLNRG